MADELSGRTALVTGGGRGIGRGIALTLARAGADVAINYTRTADAAEATATEIRALGRRAEIYPADVSDFAQCEAMVARALADFGQIGILVNNAGIASRGNAIVDTDPAEMERVVRTHAFGTFYMSRLLVPQMRELERGDVVMISSGAAQSFGGRGAPYNMGKAAQEAVAYTLAKEERQHGIRVNVVAPGLVESDMGFRLARATRGISDMREMDERSPFGFVCQPEDIANAVLYLVGESGRYVTNQRITVNGGGF
ncbi:MAG: SDR family NAD(P)-dependent oxidoreductase [Chloroflexi bacterium]|nr:SDR family NAD(P)-dependent oxidoreductase [Chloroflexota bacterium]MDA1003976.1 SDR family NAD(P)-dependent oxidoreductase [Chloroflexota bacterium]